MKHHPRYNNCINLSDWFERFPWLEWTTEQNPYLIARSKFHITAFSTTAFEYAAEGVPTCFFWDALNPEGNTIFLQEYAYPGHSTFEEMQACLNDESKYDNLSQEVKNWVRKFYTPFSATKCIELLEQYIGNA
jgi:hypothetical protein